MIDTDITVSAIIRRNDSFLCIDERNSRGDVVLNIPGGHIEAGETPEQAIIREVREETRWDFTPTGFVGAYLWRDAQRALRYLRLIYCGEALAEQPHRPLDEGIVAVHWRSRDAIASEQARLRAPVVLTAIDDFLLGRLEQLAVEPHGDPQSLLSQLSPLARHLDG